MAFPKTPITCAEAVNEKQGQLYTENIFCRFHQSERTFLLKSKACMIPPGYTEAPV